MRTSRWLLFFYSTVVLLGIFLALPNFLTKQQIKDSHVIPDTKVTLGLDLQGGSYLVLQLDQNALIKDDLRIALSEIKKNLYSSNIDILSAKIDDGHIKIELENKKKIADAVAIIRKTKLFNSNFSEENEQNPVEIETNSEHIFVKLSSKILSVRLSNAIQQSIEIIRHRIDQIGVTEPSIQKVGADQIMVQLPGLNDPTNLRRLLGTTAKMSFHLVQETTDTTQSRNDIFYAESMNNPELKYALQTESALDGSALTDARASFDSQTGQPIISFRLNNMGARIFSKLTQDNIGKALAIVLDKKILTAPVIQSAITNGTGQITGNFTAQDTTTLAALLRAGSLPVPLNVIEERTVGPELGADAIKMGLYTGILGYVLVAVFIFFLYGVWGLIADIALFLHTILTFSVLGIIGATLTLPGIAGIILGIGIAVDSNILINERIKEETRKGASALLALDRGFKNAFSTIIDANCTAVIATALLFWFGTGPIRGFAVTMFLGIVISLFTDVIIVRLIMRWFITTKKYNVLKIKSLLSFKPSKTQFKFMNVRYWGIGTSLVLSLLSCVLLVKPGLNYGIDFVGGIQIEVTDQNSIDFASLRRNLNGLNLGEISLQNVGSSNSLIIRIQKQNNSASAELNVLEKTKEMLQKAYPNLKIIKTEVVGPKVSSDLAKNGFIAIVLAAVCMCLYIWWRFEWYFAAGAIMTLILDTTKILGFFVLFQIDFNLTAIAALLTIIGYSVNDKVVVYDRMRENLRLYQKMPLRELINLSINQVFIRCIFTSTATFLAMLPMALFGGSAVHSFSVPMLIGIIIATTSSIFIAAPIMLFLSNWWEKNGAFK